MDHSSFTCWTLKWCRKHNWAGRSSPKESWGYSYVSAAPEGKEKLHNETEPQIASQLFLPPNLVHEAGGLLFAYHTPAADSGRAWKATEQTRNSLSSLSCCSCDRGPGEFAQHDICKCLLASLLAQLENGCWGWGSSSHPASTPGKGSLDQLPRESSLSLSPDGTHGDVEQWSQHSSGWSHSCSASQRLWMLQELEIFAVNYVLLDETGKLQ